ncbi:Metal-dependent protease-like protein, putative molecular chaperone [Lactobacillus brevis ATCC 367] [Lacticaseibacillus rhamnosus]|nr:Metal-dependent protease-like protein, putative molecular chaperone [Lactobacillus brevis ATCC 367] [Lacticaseibacillus rhamnosus]
MFFYQDAGAHRHLLRVARRQRQMCIRDSVWFLGDAAHFDDLINTTVSAATPVVSPWMNLPQAATIGLLGSVSYTHLRAHETEADLVCRLLLEKKKYKTYTECHLSIEQTRH